jgi:hypothetical protein
MASTRDRRSRGEHRCLALARLATHRGRAYDFNAPVRGCSRRADAREESLSQGAAGRSAGASTRAKRGAGGGASCSVLAARSQCTGSTARAQAAARKQAPTASALGLGTASVAARRQRRRAQASSGFSAADPDDHRHISTTPPHCATLGAAGGEGRRNAEGVLAARTVPTCGSPCARKGGEVYLRRAGRGRQFGAMRYTATVLVQHVEFAVRILAETRDHSAAPVCPRA